MRFVTISCLMVVASLAKQAAGASFIDLSAQLPSGTGAFNGISADGNTILLGGPDGAHLWHLGAELFKLPLAINDPYPQDTRLQPRGLSADGTSVVGFTSGPRRDVFRWTAETGTVLVDQPFMPYAEFVEDVRGVSPDTRTVIGTINFGSEHGGVQAYRLTDDESLELFPYGSYLTGNTADSLVVSTATDPSNVSRLVGDSFEPIGTLPGSRSAYARLVSSDGRIIVGFGWNTDADVRAFKWTAEGGMERILDEVDFASPYDFVAMTPDASVIGGTHKVGDVLQAFVWDSVHGVRDLVDLAATLGVDVTPLESMYAVRKMSTDGLTIVGSGRRAGTNQSALFRFYLGVGQTLGDTDNDGDVDLADLNNVRNNFGGTGLGDTEGNGTVDLADLNNVRNHFGESVPAINAVPEPTTFALLTLCAATAAIGLRPRRQ